MRIFFSAVVKLLVFHASINEDLCCTGSNPPGAVGISAMPLLHIHRGYLFFSMKDQNLFYRVDTIGNIFMSGAAKTENITDGVHEMK